MNDENLIPNGQRTPSELRENAKKGGKASGEARREKKRLTEALKSLLSLKYDVGEEKNLVGYKAISVALIRAAIEGNVKAYEVIRDTIGEKPSDTVNIGNGGQIGRISIAFVDKSGKRSGKETDPKIVGEYTPPLKTEE